MGAFVLIVLGYDSKYHNYPDNVLTRADGIMLLVLFGIFMYYLIELALTSRKMVRMRKKRLKRTQCQKVLDYV